MKKSALILLAGLFLGNMVYAGETELETIGAISASNLYVTYLAIGSMADGFEKKTYEAKQAATSIQAVVNMSGVAKKYLQKLIDENIVVGSDIKLVREMLDTYDFLINEGTYLIRYTKSRDNKDAQQFHHYRGKAWDNIKRILKIK